MSLLLLSLILPLTLMLRRGVILLQLGSVLSRLGAKAMIVTTQGDRGLLVRLLQSGEGGIVLGERSELRIDGGGGERCGALMASYRFLKTAE